MYASVDLRPVGPRKDMLESPAAYLFFSFLARHVATHGHRLRLYALIEYPVLF